MVLWRDSSSLALSQLRSEQDASFPEEGPDPSKSILPRGLPEAEGSAGLQKGDQDHGARGAQHWVLLPDAPGWRWLTEGALPLALRASPGEETESQGDPQASPHCWACPEKEKSFLSSSGTASVLSRHFC
ncbi:hypothetical protein D623_10012303 [Myotis brandtii]|uniref:Uncharacterized protein n=1 Tax=Myotis brandtii TaxID=109478 RepID=S7PYY7_MYOBR|nr:hypothetical protein D623_10012303 [Myotis brandtii]